MIDQSTIGQLLLKAAPREPSSSEPTTPSSAIGLTADKDIEAPVATAASRSPPALELSPASKRRAGRLLYRGISKHVTASILKVRRSKLDSTSKRVLRKPACSKSLTLAADRIERQRIRILVSMVQCGGEERRAALYRLREKYNHPYLRFVLAGYNSEHNIRSLDCSSRNLLIFLWDENNPCETWVLCIVVFVRICLVDRAPILRFLAALRGGATFLEAGQNELRQLIGTRPEAYKSLGRDTSKVEYTNRRDQVFLNLQDLVANPGTNLVYTPASFQKLCTLKDDECDAQFAKMQLAMDLELSPIAGQRKRIRDTQKLFHCAGTGLYTEIAQKLHLCRDYAEQLFTNTQFKSILKDFDLPVTRFFLAEHGFCGDRKYENHIPTALEVEANINQAMQAYGADSVGALLRTRYADAAKEIEYQRVLQIIRECGKLKMV